MTRCAYYSWCHQNFSLTWFFQLDYGPGVDSTSQQKWVPGRWVLHSWDRASFIYSSITNKMQRYTIVFVTINALHVSGGSSAHHQELNTAYTASGICRAFSASYRYCQVSSNSLTTAVRSRKSSTNTRCCVCSTELLMMGGGTAWNM